MVVFRVGSENANYRFIWKTVNACISLKQLLRNERSDHRQPRRNTLHNPEMAMCVEIYNEGQIAIVDSCITIANKLLNHVGMIASNGPMHDAFDQELNREHQYERDVLQEAVQSNVPLLNDQQKNAYKTLMQSVDNHTGGIFFLDTAFGSGDVELALASSGIAATLWDGARTAHSALKLPLSLNTMETPTCNIARNSAIGKLLIECKLIVWYKCTVAHKNSIEALNISQQDIRRNNNIFGGVMILLRGDYRQSLPVIPHGTSADELNACLKASWKHETIALMLEIGNGALFNEIKGKAEQRKFVKNVRSSESRKVRPYVSCKN